MSIRKTPSKMVKPDPELKPPAQPIIKGNTFIHELQFLQTFFDGNRIMPLDANRIYSIIETDTYNRLYTVLPEYMEKTTNLTQALYKKNLQIEKLQTELQKLRDFVEQCRINEDNMILKLKESFRDSMELNAIKNNKKASQLNQKIQQSQSFRERVVYEPPEEKKTASVSIQTEYNLHYSHNRIEEESSEIILSDDTEKNEEEEKLCRILEEGIINFEEEFEKQMNQLNEQQLKLEKWEEENKQLKEENEELKKQIHQNKLEEEQLDIWRTNVTNLVSKLEGTIVKSNPIYLSHQQTKDKNEEQIENLKAQVIELRGRIVQMKQKIKWVEEVMQGEEEIGDEGAVGVLVRLSQRLKSIVKNMMMEIERV